MCNVMWAFNNAKPAISHSDLIFFWLKHLCSITGAKYDAVFRNQDTNIYYVYGDINIQGSLCACKHHITVIRLLTRTLKSM